MKLLILHILLLFVFRLTYSQNFEITIKTDNPGNSNTTSFTIPTHSSYTYSYNIDWENDGTFDDFGVTGDITHDYVVTGTYQIAISGMFPSMYFYSPFLDNKKIISIDQWGNIVWRDMKFMFRSCSNLSYNATDLPNLLNVTTISGIFTGCSNMIGNNTINNWDVSNIEDMSNAFSYTILFNIDISNWNTINVTNMQSMFSDASNFNQNINNWNTTNVDNMSYMFYNAPNFDKNISSWNTINVINMQSMFSKASNFNQDISNWNVSNVEKMQNMFQSASLFDQNLGNWDIGNVTNMINMFSFIKFSTCNYDNTLMGWASQSLQPNVSLGAFSLNYCLAVTERNILISPPNNWTITDAGLDCSSPTKCTVLPINEHNAQVEQAKKNNYVYPNPISNDIVYLITNGIEIDFLKVYNLLGQDVSHTVSIVERINSKVTLDFSKLSSGSYLISTPNYQYKVVKY